MLNTLRTTTHFTKKKKSLHIAKNPLQRTNNNQLQIHKKTKTHTHTHYKQLITHKHYKSDM